MAFEKEKPTDIATMSEEMKKALKKEVFKYGCQPYQYLKFYEEVKVQRGDSVMQYPISEMETYRDRYVKKFEKGLNDSFVFEKYSRNGEYFTPRAFWDKIVSA